MRSILDAAARIGAGIVRSLVYAPRDPAVYYYPDGTWETAFVGGSHEFLANGARLLDARAMMHYVGTGITPAMTHAAVGVGSQYAFTARDANGAWLDGGRSYTLTLPAPIPAKTFWAIDIYDPQTRSLLQTDNPYPSINSQSEGMHTEDNGDLIIDSAPPTRRAPGTGCRPSRQGLVPDPAPLRPTGSLVRQDLATRGDPTRRLTRQRAATTILAVSGASGRAALRAEPAEGAHVAAASPCSATTSSWIGRLRTPQLTRRRPAVAMGEMEQPLARLRCHESASDRQPLHRPSPTSMDRGRSLAAPERTSKTSAPVPS